MSDSNEKPFDCFHWLGNSPWFYGACFCACGLVAIFAISPKYNRRQAKIEQNYQARSLAKAAERTKADSLRAEETGGPSKPVNLPKIDYSMPENTLVGLLPIGVVLGIGLVASFVVLTRQYSALQRPKSHEPGQSMPDGSEPYVSDSNDLAFGE